ncbi:MAG: helix-turn-helix domain-containing protein [Burkholderiaceae bacterium]
MASVYDHPKPFSSFSASAPDPAGTARRYSAPALEKGLEILEALSETSQGYTLRQLAEVLGRNVNEIFRMVVVLRQAGYIQVDDGDRHTLTLKMFRLAHRQPPLERLMQISQPLLAELAERTRQSCQLMLYRRDRVVVVGQANSPEGWQAEICGRMSRMLGATDPDL